MIQFPIPRDHRRIVASDSKGVTCRLFERELAMANPDLQPLGDLRHGVRSEAAISIASDFTALVTIFERQLETLSSSDAQTRAQLRRETIAAERGVELTQRLIEQVRARG